MGHRVDVDLEEGTVTATRNLRESGGSTVLTIPPEVMDAIGVGSGDELVMVADHDSQRITIEKRPGDAEAAD